MIYFPYVSECIEKSFWNTNSFAFMNTFSDTFIALTCIQNLFRCKIVAQALDIVRVTC